VNRRITKTGATVFFLKKIVKGRASNKKGVPGEKMAYLYCNKKISKVSTYMSNEQLKLEA
jgi:hypothetical protein